MRAAHCLQNGLMILSAAKMSPVVVACFTEWGVWPKPLWLPPTYLVVDKLLKPLSDSGPICCTGKCLKSPRASGSARLSFPPSLCLSLSPSVHSLCLSPSLPFSLSLSLSRRGYRLSGNPTLNATLGAARRPKSIQILLNWKHSLWSGTSFLQCINAGLCSLPPAPGLIFTYQVWL